MNLSLFFPQDEYIIAQSPFEYRPKYKKFPKNVCECFHKLNKIKNHVDNPIKSTWKGDDCHTAKYMTTYFERRSDSMNNYQFSAMIYIAMHSDGLEPPNSKES